VNIASSLKVNILEVHVNRGRGRGLILWLSWKCCHQLKAAGADGATNDQPASSNQLGRRCPPASAENNIHCLPSAAHLKCALTERQAKLPRATLLFLFPPPIIPGALLCSHTLGIISHISDPRCLQLGTHTCPEAAPRPPPGDTESESH